MRILLVWAKVVLFLGACMEKSLGDIKSQCDSYVEDPCEIFLNCWGAADLNMQLLVNALETHNNCVKKTQKTRQKYDQYYGYRGTETYFDYPYASSFEIFLDIDYNIDKFWNSGFDLDSHIKTVSFHTIGTVPKQIKQFRIIKELAIVDFQNDTLDLNSFLGIRSLRIINASSNNIRTIQTNLATESGYVDFIDLSHNIIEVLPNLCFSKFAELKNLNLSHNSIKSIEILTFEGISKLEVLDLSFNMLTDIYQSLARFIDLKELYINDNSLSSIPGTYFKTMTNLEKLNLRNNNIIVIDADAFKILTKLKEIDISYNSLHEVDFQASALKNLTIFNAEHNNITKVSKSMFDNLSSIEELNLSHNNITKLEPQTFKHEKLKCLDVSNNIIEGPISENFFKDLKDVVKIQLNENKFTSVENDAFNGLHNLLTLNLSNCKAVRLGYHAFNNTGSIQVIDLSHNSLQNISLLPESIHSLKEIYINDNEIRNFSKETFASSENIDIFNVANNVLLKDSILLAAAKRLSYVDISNTKTDIQMFLQSVNTLSDLSMANIKSRFSFENIVNITIENLDLSSNDIDNVNSIFVFRIHNLKRLDLKCNKLTFIDKFSFQNMPSLTWLDLSSNMITQIQPGSFLHTSNIAELNLHNNSLMALKFGMFQGLNNLMNLNLSSNMIFEFSFNLLHSTPKLSKIILDKNQITDIRLREFIKSHLTVISIGGNPLSCHTLANFKQYTSKYNPEEIFRITAEILDFHNDNFNGIRCISDMNNYNLTFPQSSNDINGSTALMYFSRELANFRLAIESVLKKNDTKSVSEKHVIDNTNVTNIFKSIDDNTKRLASVLDKIVIMFDKYNNETYQSLKDLITKITLNATNANKTELKIKYLPVNDTSILDQHLNEKLKIMNTEKEKLIKEIQTIFEDLRSTSKGKTEAQTYENDSYKNSDIKGVLYFVAICLLINIIILIIINGYKILRNRNALQRNTIFHNSSQPLDNDIELS